LGDFYGFCDYWPFPKIYPWPSLNDLLRAGAEYVRVMVIAPVSACSARTSSRPLSTGHESRRRHRGLGGRNFR
jgi:hypothetical protein